MRIDQSGNVGIGTTNPLDVLHVVGTGYFTAGLGVGTSSPNAKLQVTAPSGITSAALFTTNDYVNGTTGSDLLIDFGAASGNTYTRLSAVGTGGNSWQNMVLQSGGGSVGIGSTNPAATLDVAGSIRTSNITGSTQCVQASTTGVLSGTGSACGSGSGSGTVTSSTAGQVAYFQSTGTTVIGTSTINIVNGLVGIDTSSPKFPLDVETSGTTTFGQFGNMIPVYLYDPVGKNATTTNYYAGVGLNLYYNAGYYFGMGSASSYGAAIDMAPGNGTILFKVTPTPGNYNAAATTSTAMVIGTSGYVRIANTSPSYILDVTGQARFTGGYTTSDRRWKTDIEPLKDFFSVISQLQGVNFDWKRKDFPKMNFAEGKQIGFIAQDVEKVLPAIVSTDKDGYKNLSYESVTPVLVEAVKELKADNDNLRAGLKAANDNLAAQHATDAARFDKLEQELAHLKSAKGKE